MVLFPRVWETHILRPFDAESLPKRRDKFPRQVDYGAYAHYTAWPQTETRGQPGNSFPSLEVQSRGDPTAKKIPMLGNI